MLSPLCIICKTSYLYRYRLSSIYADLPKVVYELLLLPICVRKINKVSVHKGLMPTVNIQTSDVGGVAGLAVVGS